MKRKILKISLVTVMVISMVVILTGCTKNENVTNEKNQLSENKTQNIVENNEKNIVENKNENAQNKANVSQTTKTDKEIVEELFNEYLELGCEYIKPGQDNTEYEKAEEYKINKIEILSGDRRQEAEDKQELSEGQKINEKDIFAEITYSVKPKNIKDSAWVAGNGEIEGEWIVKKMACVFVHNDNGTYKIQGIGTDW